MITFLKDDLFGMFILSWTDDGGEADRKQRERQGDVTCIKGFPAGIEPGTLQVCGMRLNHLFYNPGKTDNQEITSAKSNTASHLWHLQPNHVCCFRGCKTG